MSTLPGNAEETLSATFTAVPVPEPASGWVVVLGGWIWHRRRRSGTVSASG